MGSEHEEQSREVVEDPPRPVPVLPQPVTVPTLSDIGGPTSAAPIVPLNSGVGRVQRSAARSGSPGLPSALQSGIESMSGVSMDGVRVHRNSTRPAEIGALAYTQGDNIFVGPGQERHLPHEAWHVVQQAQGRVAPRTSLASGDGLNDDVRLEREADVMGSRAMRRTHDAATRIAPTVAIGSADPPVQMVRENEFRADPSTFLAGNVLSLTMAEGMNARTDNAEVRKVHGAFLRRLASFDRHWFTLVLDVSRTKPERSAYILTPALEKYVQAWPHDELFTPLIGTIGAALPIGADASYLSSAYVDYKNIGVTDDHDATVGHTTITTSRDAEVEFNPDFVFTAAMNGCAFAFTPTEDPASFTAWHFQSTTANRAQAARFRGERAPTDWFGEDEYDSGSHAGLFEVTNFLHRGADDSWNIISQQNETSAMDMSDVTIDDVTSRPLNLGAPDKANILKKIYTSLQVGKDREVRRGAVNGLKNQQQFPLPVQRALQRLSVDLHEILGAEEELIRQAATLPELHAAATGVRTSRTLYVPMIKIATDAVIDELNRLAAVDRDKWKMFQNDQLYGSLINAVNNLASIETFLGQTDWITALIGESAPPVLAGPLGGD